MRRLIALALVASLTVALIAPAAEARHGHVAVGVGAAVGLALVAPFIIAGTLFAPLVQRPVYAYPPVVVERPVAAPPPVYRTPAYASPPPVYGAQAAPTSHATTVQYPHGRYELRGDGVQTAYQWVWIPNAPPPPAAPPSAP